MNSKQMGGSVAKNGLPPSELQLRDEAMLEMKIHGLSLIEVADRYQCSVKTVRRGQQRAQNRRSQETADTYLAIVNEQLNAQYKRFEAVIQNPRSSMTAVTQAIVGQTRNSEARMRLNGLEPVRTQKVEVTHIEGGVDAEVARLAEDLGLSTEIKETA